MYRTLYKDSQTEIREYPPQRRTVFINGNAYYLQFPYIVFGHKKYLDHGGKLSVLFTDRPIRSWWWFGNKTLYCPPLPNLVSDKGDICLGNIDDSSDAAKCIHFFWNSGFGGGEYDNYFYKEWEKSPEKVRKRLFGRPVAFKKFKKSLVETEIC